LGCGFSKKGRRIMSKKMNKTLIGAFVMGAIGLLVVAVLVFGSGKFFAPTSKFVMFFSGSVKGLNVGAPVMFNGVKIGEVTGIQLRFNPQDMSTLIPVYIEIDRRRFVVPGGESALPAGKYKYIKPLIEKGLKAQLQMQSFVTGQLMINLDFYPDKPLRLVKIDTKYPQIPTTPTALEELSKTLEELPLKDIITKLDLTIDGIQKLVSSPKVKETIESLNVTLKDTQELIQHVDLKIDPLVKSLTKTSDTAQDTLVQAKNTISTLEGNAAEVMATAKNTLKSSQDTLKQVDKTLGTFSEDSRLTYELERTLRELSAVSRSIRSLSDYLERHPEALLRGKKQQ
jgi:paraquat-inducible protein B